MIRTIRKTTSINFQYILFYFNAIQWIQFIILQVYLYLCLYLYNFYLIFIFILLLLLFYFIQLFIYFTKFERQFIFTFQLIFFNLIILNQMKKYSNQQSSQNCIRVKKQNFKAQIRRKQIQDYFAARRIELFLSNQNKKQISQKYTSLNNKILSNTNNQSSYQQIQNQIKSLICSFPNQKGNFCLVGNYMLINKWQLFKFEDFILDENNILLKYDQNFVWCLNIYIASLNWLIENLLNKTQYISLLQKIDNFLASMMSAYWNDFQFTEKNIKLFESILYSISVLMTTITDQSYFPTHSTSQFILKIQQFYKQIDEIKKFSTRSLKIQISSVLNQLIQQIKKRQFIQDPALSNLNINNKYTLSSSTIQKLIRGSALIFYDNIKDASQFRKLSIQSIKYLSQNSPVLSGEYIFSKKNVNQFIYLMVNHKQCITIQLLKAFIYVLPQTTDQKLQQFLQCSLHINLTQILKKSLEELSTSSHGIGEYKYSDKLFFCLKTIQLMLHRISTLSQKLLYRVLDNMMQNEFDKMLEYMGTQKYKQSIEVIYSEILDEYFSQDECPQNMCNELQMIGFHKHCHHQKGKIHNNYYQNACNDKQFQIDDEISIKKERVCEEEECEI